MPLDHLNEGSLFVWHNHNACVCVRACVRANMPSDTTISKVNVADNDIHHSVSLALSSDLFHIMLSNVSGGQIIGRYDDQ